MAKKDYLEYYSNSKRKCIINFFKYIRFMKKKGYSPVTKVKNPEPKIDDPDWIIWAAWADRITFEEIKQKTGKPSSFKLWRKRVHEKSIKHKKKFEYSRKEIASKIKKSDYL